MVTRGGRSKGCSDCRRRKVKCDESRPVCLRCKKRGVDCDGPRYQTWVDQTETFSTQSSSPNKLTKITRPVELSFIAFEDNICLAYTRKKLFRGGLVEVACDKIDWRENSSTFLKDPSLALLRKAILSLSVTFFGSQHHDARITTQGYDQYGEVLQQLNTALTIPEQQTTNETLLTALTCMLLEIFLPTGPSNFLKHQRGIDAIMSLRGPPTETTGDTATIFQGLRIISIIGALVDARPSIYAKDEWKHAPMPYTDGIGMLKAEIFTVLAECTQLMSDRDTLVASSAGPRDCETLLARLDHTMSDLCALYPLWVRTNNDQMQLAGNMSRMADELGIANHLSATAYMLYHTVHICILQIRDSLDPSSNNMKLRNEAASKIASVLEIKECEKREGFAESNTIGFVATKVAWQALGGFSTPEGRRLARAVGSAVDGVSRSPGDSPSAWSYVSDATQAGLQDAAFAAWVVTVT
ncbi:hypothetical protein CC86DRAFT_383488 [Ophiobolus disseminans]|uniref:Zn(2)-C6 fungal-type domain-containing protein n=1 Tax=Ophiobolus disseminans TaxID=1469910 RepID=A0A6A6ZWD3_9PLEO|nr:hypothetical protein CC86DRAFT_383488 [Ophiobolus disseminans]